MSSFMLDMEYSITLSCNGWHSWEHGYEAQNYARYLDRTEEGNPYMQVMFPFPIDIAVTKSDGGWEERYVPANTWLSNACNTHKL